MIMVRRMASHLASRVKDSRSSTPSWIWFTRCGRPRSEQSLEMSWAVSTSVGCALPAPSLGPSLARRSFATCAGGPYPLLGTTMLGPKKGKKWASTSKLPTLKQTI